MKKNVYKVGRAQREIFSRFSAIASLSVATTLAAIGLSACGGDDSSSSSDEFFKEVETKDDLGDCAKENLGEVIYVSETDSLYECASDGWVATDSSALAQSSSSVKSDSTVDGSSSSVKSDSTKNDTASVKTLVLWGYAHKGPFVSGSEVTVFGLDSLLEKTETRFWGKVLNDSGAYKVEKVSLPGRFALVQVKGAFRSEIDGQKMTAVTLNAIADLSEGEKKVFANVNVFTELEYARVKYLVVKKKMDVVAAKKQATKELLVAFGGEKFSNATAFKSTSISLYETRGDKRENLNVVLLASSILLLGDLSSENFSARMEQVAKDFAENGKIDSDKISAELADWAAHADSNYRFDDINHYASLLYGGVAPNFEYYLTRFWTDEYGIGECNADREDSVSVNKNSQSKNFGVVYICRGYFWYKGNDVVQELGACSNKNKGAYASRESDGTYYKCVPNEWMKVTETEGLLGECSDKVRPLELKTVHDTVYACRGLKNRHGYDWGVADEAELKYGLCGTEKNPEGTFKGDVYYCNGWYWMNVGEIAYGLKTVCSDSLEGDIKEYGNNYYVCGKNSHDQWEWLAGEYLQDFKKICAANNDGEMFETQNGYLRCVEQHWLAFDHACSSQYEGYKQTFENTDRVWECVKENGVYGWQPGIVYTCDGEKTYSRVVKIGEQTWMAENLNCKTNTSYCYHDGTEERCDLYGRYYRWDEAKTVCPEGWALPTENQYKALMNEVGNKGEELKSTKFAQTVSTDKFGFTVLPGGDCSSNCGGKNSDFEAGSYAKLWTSDEFDTAEAYQIVWHADVAGAYFLTASKGFYLPVRCIAK